jgi:hypothetical protein
LFPAVLRVTVARASKTHNLRLLLCFESRIFDRQSRGASERTKTEPIVAEDAVDNEQGGIGVVEVVP